MTVYANGASWTAAELLADVRRAARIPAGSLDFTDVNLRRTATEVITSFAGWAMSKAGEARELFQRDYSSATAVIDSPYGPNREILLPPQALAGTIDSVFWVSSDGKERRLELIDIYQQPLQDTADSTGEPWGFALLNHRLRVYPMPQTAGKLRVNYQRRHPELIEDAPTNLATTSGGATTTATTVTFPTSAAPPFNVSDYVDLVNSAYPYQMFLTDVRVTNVGVSDVTVSCDPSLITSDMATGTRIVKSGQSPYIHLPLEFRLCLNEKIAEKLLREVGDARGAMAAGTAAETELQRVIQMLNPRTQSARQKLRNPNSLMRTRRFARWGRF